MDGRIVAGVLVVGIIAAFVAGIMTGEANRNEDRIRIQELENKLDNAIRAYCDILPKATNGNEYCLIRDGRYMLR